MPYKSEKQRRYFNANRKKLEAEGVDVGHWNEESKGMDLPEKAAILKAARAKQATNYIATETLGDALPEDQSSDGVYGDIKRMSKMDINTATDSSKIAKDDKPRHDACYHSVKRRYKVFPSAYASGAIAKCRKAGGPSKKKSKTSGVRKSQAGADLKRWFKEDWVNTRTGGACGDGKGKGTPYCRPKKRVSSKTPKTKGEMSKSQLDSKKREKNKVGLGDRVKPVKRDKKSESMSETYSLLKYAREKAAKKKSPAWTRSEGKSESGGLNEKGRKSYERANPGSNLKRPQPEGGKRQKSYCSRSKGQMKMHNISCSKDPDKRICKARRKWKCSSESLMAWAQSFQD